METTYGYPEPGTDDELLLISPYGVKLPPPVPLLCISPNWAPICGADIASEKHTENSIEVIYCINF